MGQEGEHLLGGGTQVRGGGAGSAGFGVLDEIGVGGAGGVEVTGAVGVGEQRLELATEVGGEVVAGPIGVAGGPVDTAGPVPQAACTGTPPKRSAARVEVTIQSAGDLVTLGGGWSRVRW